MDIPSPAAAPARPPTPVTPRAGTPGSATPRAATPPAPASVPRRASLAPPEPPAGTVPACVLEARRGQVLDLRSLDEAQARAVFRMDEADWQTLAERSEIPITEIYLPAASRTKYLAWVCDGLSHLTGLRQLYLSAASQGEKVQLHHLRHRPGQLTAHLTLPRRGGCLVYLPPGLALSIRPMAGPAARKNRLAVVTPGQMALPAQTLLNVPYLREEAAPGAGTEWGSGQPAPRLVMARLLKQLLQDARARCAPQAQDALRALDRAQQALAAADPRLETLLAGVDTAFALLGQAEPAGTPPARPRFDYSYARSPRALTQHLGLVVDRATERLLAHSPIALMDAERLGQLLVGQLAQLRPGEARYLALLGGRHMLAILLRRRPEGEQASVVCYDPRLPDTHVRVRTASRLALAELRLSSLLVPVGGLSAYFGPRAPRIAAVHDLRQLLARAEGLRPPPGADRLLARHSAMISPQYIRMAMHLGPARALTEAIRRMPAYLAEAGEAHLASRLEGSTEAGAPALPLLAEAIHHNLLHQVAAFIDGLLILQPLGPASLFYPRLLQSRHQVLGHTSSALSVALQRSPELAGLLTRQILDAPAGVIRQAHRLQLLRDPDAQGVPVLHRLLARSRYPGLAPALPAALHAYCYEVAASPSLSTAEKLDLLQGPQGLVPAMALGLQLQQPVAVAAMACALYEAPLDPERLAQLLEPMSEPLCKLGPALDLTEPEARHWASRLLRRVGQPGTAAAVAAQLRTAWSALAPAPDPREAPGMARRLAAAALRVTGTAHSDEEFRQTGLRAWELDESGDWVFCVPQGEDPDGLEDLEGWQLSERGRQPRRKAPFDKPLYLLPAARLALLEGREGRASSQAATKAGAAASRRPAPPAAEAKGAAGARHKG